MDKLIVLGMGIPYPYPTHGHPYVQLGYLSNGPYSPSPPLPQDPSKKPRIWTAQIPRVPTTTHACTEVIIRLEAHYNLPSYVSLYTQNSEKPIETLYKYKQWFYIYLFWDSFVFLRFSLSDC